MDQPCIAHHGAHRAQPCQPASAAHAGDGQAPRSACPPADAATHALWDEIRVYRPFNEQEAADAQVILRALETDPGCFDRTAQAHLACSVWTVDPTFSRTLLVYHNIYDSWSWIGGHADGQRDLAAVALRELEEETGVRGRLVAFGPDGKMLPMEDDADGTGSVGSANGADGESTTADADGIARKLAAGSVGASGAERWYDRSAHARGAGGTSVYSLEVLTVDGHEKRGAYVSSHLHLNVTYLAVADPAQPVRTKPDENSGVRWVPLEDAVRLSTEPWIRDRIYRKLIDKLSAVR